MRLDQLSPATLSLVKIELAREAATLILIWAASRNARSRLGAFLLAFGVWDLTFYLWLRVLIGWPPSLLTWDILFLLPVPWAAPVLAPAIVAATMTAFGAWILAGNARTLDSSDRSLTLAVQKGPPNRDRGPLTGPLLPAVLLAAAAAVILTSFLWDWRHWLAGGTPRAFPWMIFALGEALAVAGFLGFSSGGMFEKNPERTPCRSSTTSAATVEPNSKSSYSSPPPTL
jgi:hypothetical protein